MDNANTLYLIAFLSTFFVFSIYILKKKLLKRKHLKQKQALIDDTCAQISAYNKKFLERHDSKIKEIQSKGDTPPLFKDECGQLHWLKRSERRKLSVAKRKGLA